MVSYRSIMQREPREARTINRDDDLRNDPIFHSRQEVLPPCYITN